MPPTTPFLPKPLHLLCLMLLVVFPCNALAGQITQSVEESGPVRVGQPIKRFGGFTLSQARFSLSAWLEAAQTQQNGPIVVSFFATWCKPCQKGLPTLEIVVNSLEQHGVRAIIVAHGQDAETVRPFVERLNLKLPVLLDPFMEISKRLGVDKAIPRTFVLDTKGTVRAIFTSEGDDFEEVLRASLLKVINQTESGKQ